MTGPAVLVRSREQKLGALELANEVRFARARMKRDLAAGAVSAVALLVDPPVWLRTMRLQSFVASLPRFGPTRTRKLLKCCQISDAKTVGGLSTRQRAEIVGVLEGIGR